MDVQGQGGERILDVDGRGGVGGFENWIIFMDVIFVSTHTGFTVFQNLIVSVTLCKSKFS